MKEWTYKQLGILKEIVARTPPILKVVIWIPALAFMLLGGLGVVIGWLLGFYVCESCNKLRHVFKYPKETKVNAEGEKLECRACYNERLGVEKSILEGVKL